MKTYTAEEAVGEAWASIDGKLDQFKASNQTVMDGHREGYLSEAQELIQRVEKRGWVLVPRPTQKETGE